MNGLPATVRTIDDIVVGATAKSWLRSKNLLPSTWGLPTEEIQRISQTGIRLTMMYPPASVLKLQPNPLKDVGAASMIIFDANTFGGVQLTREEKIATLLHEMGHVFHDLSPKKSDIGALKVEEYVSAMDGQNESENAADDYARKLGYGEHIATSLEKLKTICPEKFNTPGVDGRIKRMREYANQNL